MAAFEQIPYDCDGFDDAVTSALRRDGVVAITNVLTTDECNRHMTQLVDSLKTLSPKLSARNWKEDLLPGGPRAGLFQSLVGQFPAVWSVRTHQNVRRVFTAAYSGLREEQIDDFVVSSDGINVQPPIGPYHDPDRDWAHLDQTFRGDPYRCVQGQVVLTDTSACFRCSPRSHHIYDDLLEAAGCAPHSKSNFCMFRSGVQDTIKSMVEAAGGQYQIPVQVPKGSMILWLSSTVHSAQLQQRGAPIDATDQWSEWRGVVYVCYRPKAEVDSRHTMKLQQCYYENRVSNHWGDKIFGKERGTRRRVKPKAKEMEELMEHPQRVYRKYPQLQQPLTPEVRALLGM
eukprot:TRINITY_DN9078_c0_g1_i4.p1 TRINITY_DN9078_c0_g1~~TRINITY_DN9078_c0_g1_i4.p1  ORF type:complete len:343 (+),score=52.67 TRINITY_DN9078_c0_g1_i4:1178-2206(+)